MKTFLSALFCGVLFGLGLSMSGMTDVSKVLGFLDLFGEWDPTLALVMGAGLLVTTPYFQFGVTRSSAPLFDSSFRLPTRTDIEVRLVTGAGLFGVGWGLVGLCPGPAFASLAYLNTDFVWFSIAMVAGMFAVDAMDRLLPSGQAA